MNKLGPVHPPEQAPAYVGAYRTAANSEQLEFQGATPPIYRYWDGEAFGPAEFTPERARQIMGMVPHRAPAGTIYWQGLVDE